MADFYVPIATGLFTDLNQQIAAGPPKPDMSFISNALENYNKGGQIKQEVGLRDVFKDGVPPDAAQRLLQIGGASQIPNAVSIGQYNALAGYAGQPAFGQQSQAVSPPSSATAIPSNTVPSSRVPADYGPQIASAGQKYGIDSGLLGKQISQESGFDPTAVSKKGATGIAQFMPGTAKQYGVNPADPNSSIDGAARYDADLLKKYGGNQGLALAAYNWGPANVDKWISSGGDPAAMPRETQAYVARITGKPIQSWVGNGASTQQQPGTPQNFQPQQGAAGGLTQPGMDAATADRYEAVAQRLNALAAFTKNDALKTQAENYMKQAEIIRQSLAKNSETPPNVKEFQIGAKPGETLTQYNARAEGEKKVAADDVDTFQKRYTGLQAAGEQSYNGLQKVQLMKQLTMQPAFYSGPLHEGVQTFNQFRSIFGANPSSALPQEAFNKVANDLLQEQVKSMGQSGVGRVLQSEVNIMKQSIASLGITPQSNRALAEILSRVYQQNQDIAGIARNVNAPPGQKNKVLDAAISDYLKQHPLFTKQEIQHPQILGAPDAPPQSSNWSLQQKQQWARSVGLKSGDPVRFGGQIVSVP